LQAILALKDRQGSSLIAIKKFIGEKHKVQTASFAAVVGQAVIHSWHCSRQSG
jgi:hypothetical protein